MHERCQWDDFDPADEIHPRLRGMSRRDWLAMRRIELRDEYHAYPQPPWERSYDDVNDAYSWRKPRTPVCVDWTDLLIPNP